MQPIYNVNATNLQLPHSPENLNTTYLTAVKFDTSVSRAAELLMDVHNPFLIYERHEKEGNQCRYIITPWDIVMKILRVRGY